MQRIAVKSAHQLDAIEGDWRETLGKTTVNRAVTIDRTETMLTITTEVGTVIKFYVRTGKLADERRRMRINHELKALKGKS